MATKTSPQIGGSGAGWNPATWRAGVAVAMALALGFVAAAWLVDAPISRSLTSWPPSERAFFRWLTQWGEAHWALVPTLFTYLAMRAIRLAPIPYWARAAAGSIGGMALFIFLGTGLPSLAATLLKRLIGRARPMLLDSHGTLSFDPWQPADFAMQSFPSGHATTAFACATVVVMLFGRRWSIVLAIAALIALSRVVVGAHYFTDVTAGALLGAGGALLVRDWFVSRRWTFERRGLRIRNRALAPVGRWIRAVARQDTAA